MRYHVHSFPDAVHTVKVVTLPATVFVILPDFIQVDTPHQFCLAVKHCQAIAAGIRHQDEISHPFDLVRLFQAVAGVFSFLAGVEILQESSGVQHQGPLVVRDAEIIPVPRADRGSRMAVNINQQDL